METKKRFLVTIELDSFECVVTAKNVMEAKKKALTALNHKKASTLIRKSYPDHRRMIYVEDETTS